MAYSPADLFDYLDRLGISHSTISHPPLFTVEESRTLRGQIPGAHTKNLFLKAKTGELFLIVARESAEIALKQLHRRFAVGRFSFGSAELMGTVLGVTPGAVTPFAAINDSERRVTVVLDSELMQDALLNFHPLDNTSTTAIARDDLVRFLDATGHPPRIVPVSGSETLP
jgi:Ala-tRNA(Pro) deacylase